MRKGGGEGKGGARGRGRPPSSSLATAREREERRKRPHRPALSSPPFLLFLTPGWPMYRPPSWACASCAEAGGSRRVWGRYSRGTLLFFFFFFSERELGVHFFSGEGGPAPSKGERERSDMEQEGYVCQTLRGSRGAQGRVRPPRNVSTVERGLSRAALLFPASRLHTRKSGARAPTPPCTLTLPCALLWAPPGPRPAPAAAPAPDRPPPPHNTPQFSHPPLSSPSPAGPSWARLWASRACPWS